MSENRVLVIGLDGASWNVLEPLMTAGTLPNISRLMQRGAAGILRSTIPPVTAPAWVSFYTGVNPGKHGVFGFETHGSDGSPAGFVSSRSVRAPRLWQLLGEQGKRVIAINVPVTSPPEPVNGIMVSGMLTPSREGEFTYPSQLRDEILSLAPDYVTDVNLLTGGRTFTSIKEKLEFVNEVRAAMRSRSAVARHFMTHYPWDLFTVVFVTMDRIQHVLWHYLDPGHDPPQGLEQVQPAIRELYSELDVIVGQLIAGAGEDTSVIIMSDHGFGPLSGAININRWLQQQGLLDFNEAKGDLRRWLVRLSQMLQWWRFVPATLRERLRSPFDSAECINWAHTKAFSGSPTEQGIFINTPDRRAGGIVRSADEAEQIKQEIKRLLPKLKDPTTGLSVIEAVHEASELFTGPYTSEAADLIYVPRKGAYLTNTGTPDYDLFDRGEYWTYGGYHHPDGVLIAQGPHVARGVQLAGASIVDLAPTILYLLDLGIPGHLDGIVLRKAFDSGFLNTHPVRSAVPADTVAGKNTVASSYSEAETLEVRARLRSLGYID